MGKPIRILIADNDLRFSERLKAFVKGQEDLTIINMVRDGQGAVTACQELLPDVILIDLHLPVLDSIKTIKSIISQNEYMKILGISDLANDRYALEAIKAGAKGFVEKNGNSEFTELMAAIRQVAKGEVVLNSTLAFDILQEFS